MAARPRYGAGEVSRGWALGDLLSTLFERGVERATGRGTRPLPQLCRALLSGRGEVSGMKLAAEVLSGYRNASSQERLAFFHFLAEDLDVDPDAILAAAQDYAAQREAAQLQRLLSVSEPPRQELLRRLNQAPGGTAELVAMRVALLDEARRHQELARVDLDFRHLFTSWFNRGFLVLRHITWQSPANILDKIIQYEAVHEIHSWADLRLRLEPPDRRLFAFFHPAMPDDPLIFVEVALTSGIPGAIGPILASERTPLSPAEADTAVFYSISNCQKGLRGISFGNSLIKQVVEVLSRDVPNLTQFVTLSPIPGLADWLAEGEDAPTPADVPEGLRALAAHYLLDAKAPDGQPRDPVARFHLGNGARVHDIHTDADLSDKGRAQSHGAMVNYLYETARLEQNHEAYATTRSVAASRSVLALAREGRTRKDKDRKTDGQSPV